MPNENERNDIRGGGEQSGSQEATRARDENRFAMGGSGEGGGPQVLRGGSVEDAGIGRGEDRGRAGGDALRSGSSEPDEIPRRGVISDNQGGGSDQPRKKQRRGFAAMDPAKQREIASKGGKASHEQGTGHEWNSEAAREAGRKGGQASRGGRGKLRSEGGGGGMTGGGGMGGAM